MKSFRLLRLACLILGLCSFGIATAHDEPTSFIDLRMTSGEMELNLTASITDLAHDLPGVEPAMLLSPETLAAQKKPLSDLIASRLKLSAADGVAMPLELTGITPIPEKRDVKLAFSHTWPSAPENLNVQAKLFPYDARHRTYLNVYNGDDMLRQEIFTADATSVIFATTKQQSTGGVVWEFLQAGIHHIAIGPDHILFVVGLMLLGGTLPQLLKIVTAFTIAHSITLGLAAFRIFSPPSSVIEPIIALSIVFVGVHALFGKKKGDPRLIFAFCFGLVHGFGFAGKLQDMVLPPHALGWSLFAFNAGVEVGQACIVLTVAPLLALLRKRSFRLADRVVAAGALCVTTAGAFWFFQRVM